VRPTIAFVLPSFAGGGAERVLITLASHLDRDRFDPVLITLHAAGPLRSLVPPHLTVHDLGRRRLRGAMPRLAGALRRLSPAVVIPTIGHLNLAVLAMRPLLPRGVRLFPREANLPDQSLATVPLPGLFRAAYRALYPGADAVICPSQAVADSLAQDFSVPAERLVLLYNPVDVDALRQAASPVRRVPGVGARFVAAGRLTAQKGFDRLIDMFAELPATAHLAILGAGPEEAALRARAERLDLGERVALRGFTATPWPNYAGADAFLLPSRWEGMPNAALEALACGTPIIATPEAGGIAEVAAKVPAGAVTVVPAGADFIAAMARVAADAPTAPRACLLPGEFRLAAACLRLETLLTG